MNDILFGVSTIPAIIGLVQVGKEIGLPGRFAPLLAVCLGVVAELGQVAAHSHPWVQSAALGIVLGLSASGLYSGAKTLTPQPPTSAKEGPSYAGLAGQGEKNLTANS